MVGYVMKDILLIDIIPGRAHRRRPPFLLRALLSVQKDSPTHLIPTLAHTSASGTAKKKNLL